MTTADLAAPLACPFCDWYQMADPVKITSYAFALTPLNPVTPGHLLVIPYRHVTNAIIDPDLTAEVFRAAAMEAGAQGGDWNFITSVGPAATQTVKHLHVHLMPRREGDGLHLPWTDQKPAGTDVCGPCGESVHHCHFPDCQVSAVSGGGGGITREDDR